MTTDSLALDSTEPAIGKRGQRRTRDALTVSGESRSQFYQRLRSEGAWEIAEELKEVERRQCRDAGLTKAESGRRAWDSIAEAFPVVDVVTWHDFESRRNRPPLIRTVEEATDENSAIARSWIVAMTATGILATRCHQIGQCCSPLLQAIRNRQELEPTDALVFEDDAVRRLNEFLVANPQSMLSHVQQLFSDYRSTGTPYSDAVAAELSKFNDVLELTPKLIDRQWAQTTRWLHGPRSVEVTRFLARACDKTAVVSSEKAH